MIASRGPAPFLLVRIIIAQVCVSVNLYFIELNSKTVGLNILNGTGLTVYYNSSILILNFNAQNISCGNNSVLESIILPENVRPTSDRYVMIPILSSGWVPTNQIAYLAFNQGNAKPILRVSNDVESVSNIVLIGSYAFPNGFFTVT